MKLEKEKKSLLKQIEKKISLRNEMMQIEN